MKIKTGKTRSYNWRKKIEQSNMVRNNCYDDTLEPTPSTQHAACQITHVNTNDWYELMNVRLHENYHITCALKL